MEMKILKVMKDVKFVGITNSLEFQWVEKILKPNDELFEKVNCRESVCLDSIDEPDAEKVLKKHLEPLIGLTVIAQAEEIGRLNDIINSMSGEVRGHKADKAILTNDNMILAQDRLILQTQRDALQEEKKENLKTLEAQKSEKDVLQKRLDSLEKVSSVKVK